MRLIRVKRMPAAIRFLWGLGLFMAAWSLQARVWEVRPGAKIQEAIGRASPGDEVRVFPGTYHEFLYVDKPDIRLIGVIEKGRWPRLDGQGILNDGIIASGSGFHVENFHVSNYRANGVMTQAANDVVIRRMMIDHTGIYGIYPTLGANIRIEDTVSWGIADAAIYVGMCTHTDVRRNEVYGNVSGIEIENSSHVLVEENVTYDNTAGILVFTLPGLPLKRSDNVIVRRNFIYDNNHPNFAARGAIVAAVPPGVGIMVLSSDGVTLEGNIIRRNSLAGIVVADKSALPPSRTPDPDADPEPDDLRILENVFYQNGKRSFRDTVTWIRFLWKTLTSGGAPPSAEGKSEIFPEGADLVFAGKGQRHCASGVETTTRIGALKLAACGPNLGTEHIATMIGSRRPLQATQDVGRQVYAAICSGCHAMSITRVGPPVIELQQKYASNPVGIVKYATDPKPVRAGFPPMPSQKYLGVDKLQATAKYILTLK